ncbi:MAG TPA: Spo0B domain-containing protein [Symbiobacteriaceae bacterium]|jgi:hypothetical protein
MDNQVLLLLRRQRHSFLNHLQVISGWLQLNQPDRARRYLETVADTIAADAQAVRSVSPELGLVLLDLTLEAEAYGARIEWRVKGDLPEAAATEFRAAVIKACATVAALADDQRTVTVTLESGGFTVHTPLSAGEG